MFYVAVSFEFDDDFQENDKKLRSVAGAPCDSGCGMGRRDTRFSRFCFEDALELKKEIVETFPAWNVTMREK